MKVVPATQNTCITSTTYLPENSNDINKNSFKFHLTVRKIYDLQIHPFRTPQLCDVLERLSKCLPRELSNRKGMVITDAKTSNSVLKRRNHQQFFHFRIRRSGCLKFCTTLNTSRLHQSVINS